MCFNSIVFQNYNYRQLETVYVHGASWKRHCVAKLAMALLVLFKADGSDC